MNKKAASKKIRSSQNCFCLFVNGVTLTLGDFKLLQVNFLSDKDSQMVVQCMGVSIILKSAKLLNQNIFWV